MERGSAYSSFGPCVSSFSVKNLDILTPKREVLRFLQGLFFFKNDENFCPLFVFENWPWTEISVHFLTFYCFLNVWSILWPEKLSICPLFKTRFVHDFVKNLTYLRYFFYEKSLVDRNPLFSFT